MNINPKIVKWAAGGLSTVLAGLFGWKVWAKYSTRKGLADAYDSGGQKAVAKYIRDEGIAEGSEATALARRYCDQVKMDRKARKLIDASA